MTFVKKVHTKDSPADHNYANDLENRIENAVNSVSMKSEATLTLASGWNGLGSSYNETKAYKVNGVVYLEGGVTGGAANSIITTLPSGFRPRKTSRFNTATAGLDSLIQISPSGAVTLLGSNSSNIFLDGISYVL